MPSPEHVPPHAEGCDPVADDAADRATARPSRDALVARLRGRGLEIGALDAPVAPHLDVTYVDRLSRHELLARFPELARRPLAPVDVVDDGARLRRFADASQDFVIACHLIEHLRDPIGALLHWQRVLRPGGHLLLVVPDKRWTFDRERAVTTNAHLLRDHLAPDPAADAAHFEDFALHVSCRTYGAAPEADALSCARFLRDIDYSIHYHVWDEPAFAGFLDEMAHSVPGYALRVVGRSGVEGHEFALLLRRPVEWA